MDNDRVNNEKMNDEELRKVNGGTGSPDGGMFEGCKDLETAPSLPAATLERSSYNGMFSGLAGLDGARRKKCTNPDCPRCGIVLETNNGTCSSCGKFLSVVI